VGHELRNPLAVISNSIYLLKMACPDANDTVREYLGMIEKETQDASRIISDLLDYSRIQPTVKEMVSLADLISGSMEKISVPISVKIIDQIHGDLPAVKVNPRQVEQILNNLLTNAIEAMPDGGEIHLTGSMKRNVISISIADSGVGIPAKDIKRIFEPLFTTKPRGIGLGLAITSKLAELNSIAIHVKSKVGWTPPLRWMSRDLYES
jgi:signal transduction histidine kinase